MNRAADPSTISPFLNQAKHLICCGRYRFVNRSKNLQALSQYGLTVADVKEEIQSLVADDYFKIKIQNLNGTDILKCLSFHGD